MCHYHSPIFQELTINRNANRKSGTPITAKSPTVKCPMVRPQRYKSYDHRGGYSFVPCLSRLTSDRASLWRRSTVPTPNKDTYIWALITFFPYITSNSFCSSCPLLVSPLWPPSISQDCTSSFWQVQVPYTKSHFQCFRVVHCAVCVRFPAYFVSSPVYI